MSRFLSEKYATLVPYTPGEQPQDMQYLKLNTNESPFPPAPEVVEAAKIDAGKLQLYSDPECRRLIPKLAARYGVSTRQVMLTNGSDDALNFAFMAFADEKHPLVFPDITYGFYSVFAELNHIPYRRVPLTADFSVDPTEYCKGGETVVIANPNAPTGKMLPLEAIEQIVQADPNRVVIVDEAYVDFGGVSALPLVEKYENLLVIQTFSKSRSLAGARLGYAIGCEALVADLNTIRYSTNPYNINRMTEAAGVAVLESDEYYMNNCRIIAEVREWTDSELKKLGFTVIPSKANFLFAASDRISGEALYLALKKRGVLIRHFTQERIANYNRITVGTREQMETFINTVKAILEEEA